MALKYFTDISLEENQLLEASLQRVTIDPAGFAGQIIYNTSERTFKYNNGLGWVSIDGDYPTIAEFNDEVQARTLGDDNLQSEVDAIDTTVTQLVADLAAEVTARQNADTALDTRIDGVETDLSNEITARTNADTALQAGVDTNAQDIDDEYDARVLADSIIENNLNNEEAARIAEDDNLQANIDAEESSRTASDLTLQSNIDAEETARINADANLQSQIDAISEEDTLNTVTTRGNTTTNSISVGDTTATSFTKVGGAANEFLKADGTIDSTDYATSSELSSETTARQDADTTLQTNIDNEEAARVSEDANLQGQIDSNVTDIATNASDISSEEAARIAGDVNLQSQIDGLDSEYVPYTGANADVVLGTNALRSDEIQITGGTGTQGTMSWNLDEATIDLIQNGTTLQLGQESHIQVRNTSGSTIANGTPCYVTGTLGASGRLLVSPMIADGTIPAKFYIGVATEDILDGVDGKVAEFGKVRDFDTTPYNEGDILYVSETTAGEWQTTIPVAPHPIIEAAFVINSKSNGVIFVRTQIPISLSELNDIDSSTATNGDVIRYNSTTQVWENSNGLTNEITDRADADNVLQGNIDTEEAARIAADNTLQSNIDAELTNRTNADNALDSRITTNEGDISDLQSDKQNISEKGQANGYASLDGNAKVPESQLPDSILGQVVYEGTWDASTNTPTLANPPASTTKGDYYIVDVDGTQFGISFNVGDWIISKGDSWQKVDNSDAVTTVFGRLGNIVANESDYSGFYPLISDLTTEANSRIAGDANLQSQVTQNSSDISSNESDITQEIADRIAGDNALQASVNTNASDIATNSSDISDEVTARTNADTTLQNNINSEATARAAADAALDADIQNVADDLSTESSTRASADTTLQNNINTEATTRANADTALQSNIDDEETARIAGDANLQGQIDAIPSPNNATITVSGGSGISGSGNFTTDQSVNETITLSHADTSSQGSVNNPTNTFIQDITLDTYGHITGLVSQAVTIPSPNNATITIAAGTNMSGGGDFTTDQSTNETITINHANTSGLNGTYGSTSDGIKIDQITVDADGHVTAITTGETGDVRSVSATGYLTGGGVTGNITIGTNASTSSTVNTLVARDSSGDINVRLLRSEYDVTNPTINFIMTQIDTASNNYVRPSTPAQFRAAVTDGVYYQQGQGLVGATTTDGILTSAIPPVGTDVAYGLDFNYLDNRYYQTGFGLASFAGDGLSSLVPPVGFDVAYEIDSNWMRFDGMLHIGSGFQNLPMPNEPIQIDSSNVYFNTADAFFFTGHNNSSTSIFDGVMGTIYSSNGPMGTKNLGGIIDVDVLIAETFFYNAGMPFMKVNIDNNVGFNLPNNIEATERLEVRGNQSISYTNGLSTSEGHIKIEQDLEGQNMYSANDKSLQWGYKNGDPNMGPTEVVDAKVSTIPAMGGMFGSGVVIKTQQTEAFLPPPFDSTSGVIAAYPFSFMSQTGGVVLGDGAEFGAGDAKVTMRGDCSQQYAPLVAKFDSFNGGVQFPNLTTSQRDNMQNIGDFRGTVIFNTSTSKLQVFVGPMWVDLH